MHANVAHLDQGLRENFIGGAHRSEQCRRRARSGRRRISRIRQTRETGKEARKWVLHLSPTCTGLPCCAGQNRAKGGNSQVVFYPGRGKAVSLHFAWDTLVLRDMIGRRRIADVAAALAKTITAQHRKQWGQGLPVAWANEAYRVAVEKAYAGVPVGEVPKLQGPYLDAARAAAADQVKRAGVRRRQ